MPDITLTRAQIDDLVQRLRGAQTPPSQRYEQAFAEAGILAPDVPLEAVSRESLAQLEDALTRCDKCRTYQPTADMERANELVVCRACMGSLTYGQAPGG